MKKRILKITALVLALVLLAGLAWFANGVLGNPVSRILAKRALNQYVEQKYAHLDLSTERFGFDFKSGGYFAYVCSETSQDTAFYIDMDMLGHVTYDSYDTWVGHKYNTELRIREEYRKMAEQVFHSGNIPYELDIKSGDIEFAGDVEWGESLYDFAISREILELDKLYDIRELGRQAGVLTIYAFDEEVSVDRAVQIVLDITRVFDDAGVPFKMMDFVLCYPRPEDNTPWREEDVRAELLYEDIREEGLARRIQESHEAIYARFAEQDAEKGIIPSSND